MLNIFLMMLSLLSICIFLKIRLFRSFAHLKFGSLFILEAQKSSLVFWRVGPYVTSMTVFSHPAFYLSTFLIVIPLHPALLKIN